MFFYLIRKLVRYDDWCSLMIHVAMDNTIITDDISKFSFCVYSQYVFFLILYIIVENQKHSASLP